MRAKTVRMLTVPTRLTTLATLPLLAMSLLTSLLTVLATIAVVSPPAGATESGSPTTSPTTKTSEAADPSADEYKLMLLFDSSGSMADPAGDGQSKMAAAKQAYTELVSNLPAKAHVGLRAYGTEVFDGDDPAACSDSRNLVPVGPLDETALSKGISDLRPYGESPISYSLRKAAKDLGKTGKRTILLVSDGEERCDPDPCQTAKQISGLGIDLKIDVVGLKVSDQARRELRCIADSGNGTFYEADDVTDLTTSAERLAERAFRPFKVDGEPVEGSPDESEAGPELQAGRYVDEIPARGETTSYRLRRTMPGSTLHVGASARPPAGSRLSLLKLSTTTTDGWTCGSGLGAETSFARTNPVVTATVNSVDITSSRAQRCSNPDELVLTVEQAGSTLTESTADLAGIPVEIVVVEEPAATNEQDLPPEADERPSWASMPAPSDDAEEIIAGASFSDAPLVQPGAYRTSLFPGEVQFYRVRMDFGQRLQAEVEAPKPDDDISSKIDYPQGMDVRLIGPTRGNAATVTKDVAGRDETFLDPEEPTDLRGMTVEMRYANRSGCCRALQSVTIPGDYYVAVSLGSDRQHESYQVPTDVAIGVTGTAGTGAPTYTDDESLLGPGVDGPFAEPLPAGPDGGTSSDGSSAPGYREASPMAPQFSDRLVAAGIAALVGILIVGVILVLRRRRRRRSVRMHAR